MLKHFHRGEFSITQAKLWSKKKKTVYFDPNVFRVVCSNFHDRLGRIGHVTLVYSRVTQLSVTQLANFSYGNKIKNQQKKCKLNLSIPTESFVSAFAGKPVHEMLKHDPEWMFSQNLHPEQGARPSGWKTWDKDKVQSSIKKIICV